MHWLVDFAHLADIISLSRVDQISLWESWKIPWAFDEISAGLFKSSPPYVSVSNEVKVGLSRTHLNATIKII